MAIDTEAKRCAILNWASGPAIDVPLCPADNSIGAIDRALFLNIYAGNALDAPAAAAEYIQYANEQLLTGGMSSEQLLTGGMTSETLTH